MLKFTAYCTPAPQGSMKAFMIKGKPRLTCDNKKVAPFRHTVAQVAALTLQQSNTEAPYADKHVPVKVSILFCLAKPPSAPKRREWPAVKPDIDKLVRATLDALKGIAWVDDGQVVWVDARKSYLSSERVEIEVEKV